MADLSAPIYQAIVLDVPPNIEFRVAGKWQPGDISDIEREVGPQVLRRVEKMARAADRTCITLQEFSDLLEIARSSE